MEGKNEDLARKYQKKSDKQHVLDNPDTYIGSIENINSNTYIYDSKQKKLLKSLLTIFLGYINFLMKVSLIVEITLSECNN